MQAMLLEIADKEALKVLYILQEKKQIRIVEETTVDSPSLPGEPLSLEAFKNWIVAAESAEAFSLQTAKQAWARQKENLVKPTR